MALTRLRFLSSLVACVVAFPVPLLAFDTPLSDTAVREAYFLGQRRDETMGAFWQNTQSCYRLPQAALKCIPSPS